MPLLFRIPLWIAIAPRFKFMFFNIEGHSFHDLAPDVPPNFIFTNPFPSDLSLAELNQTF